MPRRMAPALGTMIESSGGDWNATTGLARTSISGAGQYSARWSVGTISSCVCETWSDRTGGTTNAGSQVSCQSGTSGGWGTISGVSETIGSRAGDTTFPTGSIQYSSSIEMAAAAGTISG